MRLILTTDSGEVLDSIHVTPDQWRRAQGNAASALDILGDLHPGTLPDEDPSAESCAELGEHIVVPMGGGQGWAACTTHARKAYRAGGVDLRGMSVAERTKDCGDVL